MEKRLFVLQHANEMTTEQLADRLFGGQFRVLGNLSQWAKEHPTQYNAARAHAQAQGIVGESAAQRAERHKRESVIHQPQEEPSAEDQIKLAAILKDYSREKVQEIFGGDSGGANRLYKENPDEYRRAQTAGRFYGVVGPASDSVRFNYPRYQRPAKGDTTTPLPPPGVSPDPSGVGYVISDPKAYADWQALQEAKKVIATAGDAK